MSPNRSRGGQQRLEATIDLLVAHAVRRLSVEVARAATVVRERDPICRLGVSVILSTLREMTSARACEALEQLGAVSAGHWWLAPSGLADTDAESIVLAAARRVLLIHPCRSWQDAVDRASDSADALARLAENGSEVSAIVALDAPDVPGPAIRAAGGRQVTLTTVDRLAATARIALAGCGPYQPAMTPRLTELLQAGRRRARLQTAGTERLLRRFGERWLIASNVRLREPDPPIGVLLAGEGGLFACEPLAGAPAAAARQALAGARRLAAASAGMRAHVTPIVICEAGTRAHQLELPGCGRVWMLGVDTLAEAVAEVKRAGVRGRRARRLKRPAPGWEYRVVRRRGGWVYEVRYDLARHRAASAWV